MGTISQINYLKLNEKFLYKFSPLLSSQFGFRLNLQVLLETHVVSRQQVMLLTMPFLFSFLSENLLEAS